MRQPPFPRLVPTMKDERGTINQMPDVHSQRRLTLIFLRRQILMHPRPPHPPCPPWCAACWRSGRWWTVALWTAGVWYAQRLFDVGPWREKKLCLFLTFFFSVCSAAIIHVDLLYTVYICTIDCDFSLKCVYTGAMRSRAIRNNWPDPIEMKSDTQSYRWVSLGPCSHGDN